jgi:hypothetical protein
VIANCTAAYRPKRGDATCDTTRAFAT